MKATKFNIATKLTMLALATMSVFTSCSKDETEPELPPVDTTEQQIAKLTREVRTAFVDAKTKPHSISSAFDASMIIEAYELLGDMPKNIVDSARVAIPTTEFFLNKSNGINTESLTNLKLKATEFIKLVNQNQK